MQPTTKSVEIKTHSGQRIQIIQVQHWTDASSKDDPHARMPGRKELRTTGGQRIAFDGSVFTLPNGDTFDPPA